MTIESLLKITESPFLSVFIWIALLLTALYFARKPFHRAVMSFSKVIRNAMRFSSASVLNAEKRLIQRNREVLISGGMEHTERLIDREFDRINAAVARDLDAYPTLHRQLADLTTRLDEDYNESSEVPPSLPTWMPIIESIAKIKHSGDSMVATMLGEINKTLNEQHKSAVEAYRSSMGTRHTILRKMLPYWRQMQKALDRVGKSITNLTERAKTIDKYMEEYEMIRAQEDQAVRKLSSSSLTQFFIAALVLLIAFGGALINFNLIALPMSEMVGGASYIGPYKTSDVAGLVIILIELTMGLFLMESLRITRLFPIIGSMDDKMRHRMIWITLTMLIVLAGVESALAFMRDRIAYDLETLRQSLAGIEQSGLSSSKIPTIGQMVMGFILPFALAFVAIPLESFVASSRTVLGIVGAGLLRMISFFLRLLGTISYFLGRFVVNVYDLAIFPAIWLEGVIIGIWHKKNIESGQELKPQDQDGGIDTDKLVDGKLEYKEQGQ
jgi:hypothetical protein